MQNFLQHNWWLIALVALWTIPWKLVALYKSARNGHRVWFVVFFFINAFAIPEICYIYLVDNAKKAQK